MTAFLKRSLTNAVLQALPGLRYEGRIVGVVPQRVFNKWKLTKEEIVPVIGFHDGWEWIPNLGARRELTNAWGPDTDLWVGRRMAVYLRSVTRTQQHSGRLVEKPEKCVELLADDDIPAIGRTE